MTRLFVDADEVRTLRPGARIPQKGVWIAGPFLFEDGKRLGVSCTGGPANPWPIARRIEAGPTGGIVEYDRAWYEPADDWLTRETAKETAA